KHFHQNRRARSSGTGSARPERSEQGSVSFSEAPSPAPRCFQTRSTSICAGEGSLSLRFSLGNRSLRRNAQIYSRIECTPDRMDPSLRFGISEKANCRLLFANCQLQLFCPTRHLLHHGQHQFTVTVIEVHRIAAYLGKEAHFIFGERRKVLAAAVGKMFGE